MKLVLNPKSGPDWTAPGQRKELVTPGQNCRRYIAGAYNPMTGHLVAVDAPKNDSALLGRLCEELSSRYRGWATVHLVMDNYSTHTSKQTRQTLEQLDGKVELHFLAPYSPDENGIERVWWDVHETITRNHRCKTMNELIDEVYSYLESYVEYGPHQAGHQPKA